MSSQNTPSDLTLLAEQLAEVYAREKARLTLLKAAGTTTGEKRNIFLIERMAPDLEGTLRRRKSDDGKKEALVLAQNFIINGAKATLLTGSQRGGDFLNNQLR